MKRSEVLITGSVLFVFVIYCSCNKPNNNNIVREIPEDTIFFTVDTFPSFDYIGLHRTIQPAQQMIDGKLYFCRDTLLSVYLEDNVHCTNYCEGIFQYFIQLDIDETGKINEAIFEENRYNSDILQSLITEALIKIHFKPAIKDNKSVPIKITTNVLIDLYNYPSKMRKNLFYAE